MPKNLHDFDLNLLSIFIIVYKLKSVTLAAKHLNLSQSSVSNALIRLKKELKFTLFIKKNSQFNPTRQARSFYEQTNGYLQGIEKVLNQQQNFNPLSLERNFKFVATNYSEILLFPKLIPYLKINAPKIKILRNTSHKNDFSKDLENEQLDLVLFFKISDEINFNKKFLFADEMVLITSLKHLPLTQQLTIKEILALDLIGYNDAYTNEIPLLNLIKQHPDYQFPHFSVSSIWGAFTMVTSTHLVAIAPKRLAKNISQYMPLRIHTLAEDINNKLEIYLYWSKMEENDKAHKWFRELVAEIMLKDDLTT